MTDELRQIIPGPQPKIEEAFAAYEATGKFYRELQSREAMKRYCNQYHIMAERHRQELQQMRGEINILSWFRARRR